MRTFSLLVAILATLALVSCSSRGNQTLYIATDRTEELTVTINGMKQVQPTQSFQAYGSAKLTKGAEVVVEANGVEIEHLTLPAVEEGMNAILFVAGAPTLVLVDYRKLSRTVDSKGRGGDTGRMGWGPISRDDIDIVPIDRASKIITFDKRAVVAGPDAPLPGGGNVNQLTLDKFPIYRLERVPAGSEPFDTIGPRVTRELGRDRLPGQAR